MQLSRREGGREGGVTYLRHERQDLDCLVHADGGNDGVGARDGRNDVFDHAEGESVGDTFDSELLGAFLGFAEDPGDVFGDICKRERECVYVCVRERKLFFFFFTLIRLNIHHYAYSTDM